MKKTLLIILVLQGSFSFCQGILIKDIFPGKKSGINTLYPSTVVMNNVIYFVANDSIHGAELWRTDGTPAGTTMVKDINKDAASSNICGIRSDGNRLFFIATSGNSRQVYISDGTELGTNVVSNIGPGGNSYGASCICEENEWNNALCHGNYYFVANDGISGTELWKTDGTVGGTTMVHDINLGSGSSNIQYLVADQSRVFFMNDSDTTDGPDELWVSDGSSAGTTQLMDSAYYKNSSGITMLMYKNKLFFKAMTDSLGFEWYATDGTIGGTKMVQDLYQNRFASSSPHAAMVVNGYLFFIANIPKAVVMYTDGSPKGAKMLIYKDNMSIGYITSWWKGDNYWPYNRKIYIPGEAMMNDAGIELYVCTPGDDTVRLFKDIAPGSSSSDPYDGIEYCGQLYFVSYNIYQGDELWKTDGTPQNTKLAYEFYKGAYSGQYTFNINKSFKHVLNDKLILTAVSEKEGCELWSFDCKISELAQTPDKWNIQVYPNPTSNVIHLLGNMESAKFVIYSSEGRKMQEGDVLNQSIDVEMLQTGIYQLHVYAHEGSKVIRFAKN